MPITVTAYKVLIGSPSDVAPERKAIESAIHAWNAINGLKGDIILIPVMWESNSAPLQGDRPQGILNQMMVKDCDIIISVFWSRIGSDTGVEKSGTVEEIKYFIKEKRPALVYFSTKPLPQDHDPVQWQTLSQFKKEIRTGGIQADFASESELSMMLIKHLSILMDKIQTTSTIASKEVNRLIKQEKEHNPSHKNLVSGTKENTELALKKHTDKSFIVQGIFDQEYKWPDGLHGQYVSMGNGKRAWQFSNKRKDEVARHLGIISEITPP